MSNHPSLEALGWGEYFEFSQSYNPECCLARVAAVDRGRYLLLDAQGSFTAKLSGRLSYHMQQANDLPCVGGLGLLAGAAQRERGDTRRFGPQNRTMPQSCWTKVEFADDRCQRGSRYCRSILSL